MNENNVPNDGKPTVPQLLSGFNEIEEELERELDAKAAKTNLTAKNVKNMLRHVITDTNVVEMIKNQLHNTGEGAVFEPRLTRAKAKELAKTQPIISWPILTVPPVLPPPSSEVRALIEEDLPEDSSDEEYNPDLDVNTISEVEITSTTGDDLGLAITPSEASPDNEEPSEGVPLQSECGFEIPDFEFREQETIGQRTRSKLDLGGLSVEEIEADFSDPDATPDLYELANINDPENRDWIQFLSEFCDENLPEDHAVEDDPDDHEYNVSEDLERAMEDSEEHRKDKAVQVTKKELNALIAELMESAEAFTQTQKKKKAAEDSSAFSPEIFTQDIPVAPQSTCPPQQIFTPQQNVYENANVAVSPEFVDNSPFDSSFYQKLWIQFQQHVQLTTQQFALTYMHPALHDQSETCRKHLNEIRDLLKTNSSILVGNLDTAMELVSEWETKLRDENFANEYLEMTKNQIAEGAYCRKRSLGHTPKFHPELIRIFLNSEALMYPRLLPDNPPRVELMNPKNNKSPYTPSEEKLLALGLSEFYPLTLNKSIRFKKSKTRLMKDTLKMISQYLMPCRTPEGLYSHVKTMTTVIAPSNPLKDYIRFGILPVSTSLSALDFDMKAPKNQEPSLLSEVWQKYLGVSLHKHKSAKNLMIALSKSTEHICVDRSLCSPIVNMLPSTKKRKLNQDSQDKADSSCKPTSPQLRKTTPRLAKIRSAQNMKLMTQVSSTKAGSSTVSVKARGKKQPRKSETSTTKVDNEEEIAELMLASTTIKKDTANRKKAKQARESENIERMLQADNESGQEERATKFAASYMQRLHMTLESSSPETLQAVIKLYQEHSKKLETLQDPNTTKETVDPTENQDNLAIELYSDVCDTLQDYPELLTDFLLFLTPHQAAMLDKSTEHMMLQKMSGFINAAQVYFAKQPSRMTKVMQAITQLASDPNIPLEKVHALMDPLLKGHQLMLDEFQQLLPADKPPDSLFLDSLFENLTCPVLPHDKHRVYTEDSAELYENIELPGPSTQEDPYGGDNCKCDCHEATESSSKTPTEHCISCGVRFLNGRVFLQTSGGLRPAKVTFSDDSEEQLENIARVSLKTTEKTVPTPAPTGRRRKSSKNDDDQAQKHCPVKSSPTKETSDEGEKATKTKRGARSPPKAVDQRRQSKSTEPGGSGVIIAAAESPAHLKSKREKRAERREAKAESKNLSDAGKVCGYASPVFSDPEEPTERGHRGDGSEEIKRLQESSDSEQNLSADAAETASISDAKTSAEPAEKPWSREHDALLLENVQRNYSEETFVLVSEMLGRSIDAVKARFETLLTLLATFV